MSSDDHININKDDYLLIKSMTNSLRCMLQTLAQNYDFMISLQFLTPDLRPTKAIFPHCKHIESVKLIFCCLKFPLIILECIVSFLMQKGAQTKRS